MLSQVGYGYQFDLIMNADGSPGTALDEDHDYIENRVTHLKVEPPAIGIEEENKLIPKPEIVNVYPNPVLNKAWIKVDLPSAVDVDFIVSDLTGRIIKKIELGEVDGGQRTLELDLTFGSSEFLLVTMKAGGYESTVRVLKK